MFLLPVEINIDLKKKVLFEIGKVSYDMYGAP